MRFPQFQDCQALRHKLYQRIDTLEKKYDLPVLQALARELRTSGCRYEAVLKTITDMIGREHGEMCSLFEELERNLAPGIDALHRLDPRRTVAMQQSDIGQDIHDHMHRQRRKTFRKAFKIVCLQSEYHTSHPVQILEQLHLLDEFLTDIRYWLSLPLYSPEVQ